MGNPPWRAMGNDAERREAERGVEEEEVVESAWVVDATLRRDASVSLWGAPPPTESGERHSPLSPYAGGRNAAAVATAAAQWWGWKG